MARITHLHAPVTTPVYMYEYLGRLWVARRFATEPQAPTVLEEPEARQHGYGQLDTRPQHPDR